MRAMLILRAVRTMPRSLLALFACIALAASLNASAQTTYRWVDGDGKVHYSDRPAPHNAMEVEEKKLGAPNTIGSGGLGFAAKKAARGAPVTLFTSTDCASECQSARDFLKQQGIPHSERVLRASEDAAAYKSATGSEDLLVPSLQVGAMAQKGFEEGAWRKLLGIAGYPLSGPAATPPR